jgi:hypothetical protein
LHFANLKKGIGDTCENGEQYWGAACKYDLLHAAIQLPFTICKKVADSLWKRFSWVVDTF